MEIPGLEAIKEMVFETETNPGKKGSGGKEYKSKQVCCRCMGSTKKVYFELISGHRFCAVCVHEPGRTVKNCFNQDVSVWNQVYSMSTENRLMGNWELKANGFAEIKLMKSIIGLFIMPWWLKFCVFGQQSERYREQYDRSTFIFQLAELLEKTESKVQNSSELENEGEIVSTGKFCLTYIIGSWLFYRRIQ